LQPPVWANDGNREEMVGSRWDAESCCRNERRECYFGRFAATIFPVMLGWYLQKYSNVPGF